MSVQTATLQVPTEEKDSLNNSYRKSDEEILKNVPTVFYVSPEEKETIKKSYGKTDEEVIENVKELKKWAEAQVHLPQDQDETLLEMMLRLNKFNMEKTQKKVDMYYSIKNVVPDFYDNRNIFSRQMKTFMETMMIVPLPQLTKDMNRIYIARFIHDDPSTFDIVSNAKFLFNLFDLRLHYDPAVGEIYIFDLGNLRLGHVLKANPMMIRKIYTVIVKGYSDRVKGLHFLNLPRVGDALLRLSTLLLSTKHRNRVFTHKDLDSLTERIPLELLPSDYNGSQKSLDEIYGEWKKFIEYKNSWLMDLSNKRSDEDRRQGKPLTKDTLFGLIRRASFQ